MDRNRIAEFVLSCVLPPDRAAAVAGDFVEEAAVRGQFWFWNSILRTTCSRVVDDFREHTVPAVHIGVIGNLRIVLGSGFLSFLLMSLQSFHLIRIPAWCAAWLIGSWVVAWQVRCGFWIARHAPNFAIASCIVAALIGWLEILVTVSPHIKFQPWGYALRDGLLISGALWARYRDVRRMWRPEERRAETRRSGVEVPRY